MPLSNSLKNRNIPASQYAWCAPPCSAGAEGGVESPTKVSKRWLDRTSTFRGGLLGKRGVTLFRVGCNFHIKNKIKSEIFNDKKKFIRKNIFPYHN